MDEGARVIAEGQRLVSRGNFLDKGGLFSGLGLAGGSNLNPQRWLDGDLNLSDVPVLGPISDFRGLQQEPASSAAPRGFDASAALSSEAMARLLPGGDEEYQEFAGGQMRKYLPWVFSHEDIGFALAMCLGTEEVDGDDRLSAGLLRRARACRAARTCCWRSSCPAGPA